MRKYRRIILITIIAVLIIVLGCSIAEASMRNDECTAANAKAELFEKAIGEFGALSPDDAAMLWGKGVQERNGALQYAVMSDELKKLYKAHLDKNYPAWVTGFSSPWVEKFNIVQSLKNSENEYTVTMQFNLATSAGSYGKPLAKLSIIKNDKYWVINKVAADKLILELSALDFMK